MRRVAAAFFAKPYAVPATVAVAAVLIFGALATGAFALSESFEKVIVPRTLVADIDVGGKTPEAAHLIISQAFDATLTRGIVVHSPQKTVTLDPLSLSPDNPDQTRPLILLDEDATVTQAFAAGHRGAFPTRVLAILATLIRGRTVPLQVTADRALLLEQLTHAFRDEETPAVAAALAPIPDSTPVRFQVTPAQDGQVFAYPDVLQEIVSSLARNQPPDISISLVDVPAALSEQDVRPFIAQAERIAATTTFSITDPDGRIWPVTTTDIASWLTVVRGPTGPELTLPDNALDPLFEKITDEVEVDAQNARFHIEGDRVVEFQGAVNGVTIDRAATAARIRQAVFSGTSTVELVRTVKLPDIETASVNSLGIKEKLGTGVSSYAGSPANRVKNIRNAVRKLNGLLIPPGETFSLIAALQPFTIAGGYLPELVIKGDKITPEIGGGACQIGTTTFRATMNSGLPVVERRNHSLVVRYYNDLSNNNPGTDATIYDPSPDYKFLNDTGHYVLFEAIMDETNKKLFFSFWGTSDGRKGSYSPPKLLRWIGTGPEKIVETTSLPPGKKECQESHLGADTTFTYTVELPTGEKKEVVFDSHYRSLPRICLVGVAAPSVLGDSVPIVEGAAAADIGAPAQ